MCLDNVYPKEKQNRIIKKLTKKGGWITVWKAVRRDMHAICFPFRFEKGINISSRKCKIQATDRNWYVPHFHLERTRRGARDWSYSVVKCKIRPSWITAIGMQSFEVIVAKKIIMPGK